MRQVKIYDTTLRDGSQAEDFSPTLADKIRIAQKLAQFGIHYIEGGWPGSNPTDKDFFQEIRNYHLGQSFVAAFGSTHHKDGAPGTDPNLQELIISQAPVVTIFGKSSLFQVKEVLQTTPERNLELVTGSLSFVRGHVRELFYDAEHFFDAFKEDKEYALATLDAAWRDIAGVQCVILCDTNGGTLTPDLIAIIRAVKERFPGMPLGIHAHNDSELAVANSLAAVAAGCFQVQGTINGLGERCGNANLCSIIPALQLKMGRDCLAEHDLVRLTELSRFVYEVANIRPNRYQPYVGRSAFAHKGGVHAAAVKRNSKAYEHISPEKVGNERNIPVSALSGRGNLFLWAKTRGIDLESCGKPAVKRALEAVKEKEAAGYQFEDADASLDLLLRASIGQYREYFSLVRYNVGVSKNGGNGTIMPEATVRLKVGPLSVHVAELGNGPVDALAKALFKALREFYPRLGEMRFEDGDYKVRVLPGSGGTDSTVRVLMGFRDAHSRWGVIGVATDVIDASWQALVDAINYKLFMDEQRVKK
jgi:2-isopropylmalate synthase